MKYPIIYQKNFQDCGIACAAMLLEWYQVSYFYSDLEHYGKKCSLWDLKRLLNSYGLKVKCIRSNVGLEKDTYFPAIIHLEVVEKRFHYIVAYEYRNGFFLIGDPAKGIVRRTLEYMEEHFTGYMLMIKG